MNGGTTIALVDGDFRRRAAISHCLAGSSIHVEPFEDGTELMGRWPRSGSILVHDDGAVIADLVAHMGKTGNWLPLVGFAENPAPGQVVRAVLDGAVDYIAWPFAAEDLVTTLETAQERSVAAGNAKVREAMALSRVSRLTQREREVLSGVASGLSNRLIGERLSISPRTVEIHRANMLNKMGANHTSEAIRIAIEASLVS